MLWKMEEQWNRLKEQPDYVNMAELVRLEAELMDLKKKNGESIRRNVLFRMLDVAFAKKSKTVNRCRYIKLAVSCGWFTGMHRFYAGQSVAGTLYLLFCWTGIPFAMTIMDLMAVLPIQSDGEGVVHL